MEKALKVSRNMKKRHPKSVLVLSGLLLTAAPTFGAITYVDAQEGINTFATGSALADESWIDTSSNTSSPDELNWMKRFTAPGGPSVGWSEHNGSDVIQGLVTTQPGALGEITTEITGLSGGIYNVWVFFWEQTVSDSQDWLIDAGLDSGSLTAYSSSLGPVTGTDSSSPVDAGGLSFSNAPSTTAAGGNQTMFGVNLGQKTISGGDSIEVYVDKLTGTGSNNRSIFDGVGYEFVGIPEPSSALLLCLGAMGLAGRRRR